MNWTRASSVLPNANSLSRYDFVLLTIPLLFGGGYVASAVLSVHPRVAIAGSAILGAIAVVDALLVNPPRGPNREPPGRSRDPS